MKERTWFLSCLTLLLVVAPLSAAPASSRPNIILITSDDHRWDALGAAGNPAIKTPVLDRLAAEGVYFRQATTHVSQCLPVRATLLTGLAAHQHGEVSHEHVVSDHAALHAFSSLPTVPGLLKEAGYRTVLVGKWHLAVDPWKTGFSEVRTWLPAGAAYYKDPLLARGNSRELKEVKGFAQQILADDAIGFVRSPAAREKPFLLWLGFTAPHVPLEPNSPQSVAMYAGKAASDLLPPGFPKDIPSNNWRHYYEALSDLDRQVGRVVAAVQEAGMAESTVLIFLGDNGHMMGERGIGAKGGEGKVVPYEGSIRVPFLVWAPGRKDLVGASDLPVSTLDVPAAVAGLAGVPAPASWSGRDFLAALRGGSDRGRPLDDAFAEWADESPGGKWGAFRLVRTAKHKLIVWKDPARPAELYDLSADPAERTNLFEKPELQATRKDLESRLAAWMERTQDPARQWPAMAGLAALP